MIGLTHCKLTAGDSDSRQKAKAVQANKLNIAKQEFYSKALWFILPPSCSLFRFCCRSFRSQPRTQQCTINNNFYAGSNKKVETVMFEMKKQLDEIQKELRNLTQKTKKENKTKGSYLDSLLTLYHFSLWIKFKYNVPTLGYRRRKSWSQRYHSWHCTWERVCNFLSLGLFFDKISLNYSHLITVFAWNSSSINIENWCLVIIFQNLF